MEPVTFLLLLGASAAIKAARSAYNSSGPMPAPTPPNKQIAFVGATGVGKSSTANALLGYEAFAAGVEHGTTTTSTRQTYHNDYSVLDTPGLLDGDGFRPQVWSAVQASEIVVYVVAQQLYRQELELVEQIYNFQRSDAFERRLLLFINKDDLSRLTMPSFMRQQEQALVRTQVAQWIASEHVVIGSARPGSVGFDPDVDALRSLISRYV